MQKWAIWKLHQEFEYFAGERIIMCMLASRKSSSGKKTFFVLLLFIQSHLHMDPYFI